MISTKSISKLTTLRHIEVRSLYRVMLFFSNLQNMQTGGLLRNRRLISTDELETRHKKWFCHHDNYKPAQQIFFGIRHGSSDLLLDA